MARSAAERCVELGLRAGRHVEGIVDACFGPPALAVAVEAAPPVEPRALVAAAEACVGGDQERFRRLLSERVRVRDMLLAGDPAGPSGGWSRTR